MIRRFLAISLAVHAGAALAALGLFIEPVVPAPALYVTWQEAGSTTVGANKTDDRQTAVAATPRATPATPAAARAAGAEADTAGGGQYTNHILGLLHGMLEQYFVYPPLARRQGWEGKVIVSLTVDADGHLHPTRIARSSGYALLDADALDTLRRIGALPQARAWLHGRALDLDLPVVYRLLEG